MMPIESNGTTLDPLRLPIIRVLGPQFWDTVYISEVDGARKVKSDGIVAMNKNSDSADIYRYGWGGQCPQVKFFQTSGNVRNESY